MISKSWTLTFPEEKIQAFAIKLGWNPEISEEYEEDMNGMTVTQTRLVPNPIKPEDVCMEAITNNMADFIKNYVGSELIEWAAQQARIEAETQIKQSILAGIAVE